MPAPIARILVASLPLAVCGQVSTTPIPTILDWQRWQRRPRRRVFRSDCFLHTSPVSGSIIICHLYIPTRPAAKGARSASQISPSLLPTDSCRLLSSPCRWFLLVVVIISLARFVSNNCTHREKENASAKDGERERGRNGISKLNYALSARGLSFNAGKRGSC